MRRSSETTAGHACFLPFAAIQSLGLTVQGQTNVAVFNFQMKSDALPWASARSSFPEDLRRIRRQRRLTK